MKSIYRGLLTRLLIGLALLWAVIGVAVCWTVLSSQEQSFDTELKAMVSEVLWLTEEHAPASLSHRRRSWLDYFQVGSGAYYEIADEFMLFWDRSPSLGELTLPKPVEVKETPRFWESTLASGEPIRGMAQRFVVPPPDPLQPGARPITVNVLAARNRAELDRSRRQVPAIAVGLGLLLLPVSFLVVRGSLGRGLRPLKQFADTVSAIDLKELDQRVDTRNLSREVQPIAERLNELLERLKAGIDRERRLNADLAHEIRTPVAELKTLAEVALAWPDKIHIDQFRSVLESARHMQSIVESLLLISRWEGRSEPPPMQEVGVAETIEEIWRHYASAAKARSVSRSGDVMPGLMLRTNPELFRLILTNLIANAVEYSPDGAEIRIEATQRNGAFELSIANPCEGLSAGDLEHIFDRFWRSDSARSGGLHAGLGLSLSKSCAAAAGLVITARLCAGGSEIIFSVGTR